MAGIKRMIHNGGMNSAAGRLYFPPMSQQSHQPRKSVIGSALKSTLHGATNVGRSLMGLHNRHFARKEPGTGAGIEQQDLAKLAESPNIPAAVTCIDYCPDRCEFQDVEDVSAFIKQHRPEWSHVRWINVDGLGDPGAIRAFAEKYDLHPLAVEDVMHVPQRPKVETYPSHGEVHGRIFIISRMLKMLGTGAESASAGRASLPFSGAQNGADISGTARRRHF